MNIDYKLFRRINEWNNCQWCEKEWQHKRIQFVSSTDPCTSQIRRDDRKDIKKRNKMDYRGGNCLEKRDHKILHNRQKCK